MLPAASRATARSTWGPGAALAEFQVAEYGAVVSSEPRLTPSTWNWTPTTPAIVRRLRGDGHGARHDGAVGRRGDGHGGRDRVGGQDARVDQQLGVREPRNVGAAGGRQVVEEVVRDQTLHHGAGVIVAEQAMVRLVAGERRER